MLKILKKYIFEILIFLLVVGIFITNYVPGTYLIGWDSLQTELYPWLAVKRAFFSVWQEYQSFGLPSGMAHAADLIRALFIFLISFVLKQNLIRYIFHHLMLFIGGVGALSLFRYLGFRSKNSTFAFLGAVFYILNLGTVQMFALPFEPFSLFFALLPWLILVFFLYLGEKTRTKKILNKFLLVNLFATSAFYQQTLFIVYLIVLVLLFLGLVVTNTFEKDRSYIPTYIKNFITSMLLIFVVNSFWLLPQFYIFKSSAGITSQSKINQLATDTVMNKNIEKGRIQYLARFENFYYDLKDTNQDFLFSSWKDHFETKIFYWLSFAPFIIVTFGFALGKKKYDIPIAAVFIFTFIIFMSGTPPFSAVWKTIRELSIIGQIFRSPFTKFVFPFVLVSSYLFATGLNEISFRFPLKGKFKRYSPTLSLFAGFSIVALLNLPVFSGNYFLPQMKVKLPEQYIEVTKFFKVADKNKRIALIPDYTFWGWYQNSWGYDGSGFLWYGVEQPIVSRTFDVWSKESEGYFWEMKRAVEARDSKQFKDVLNKYNIDYLVVDKTARSITSADLDIQLERVLNIIEDTPDITLIKNIHDIDIYSVTHSYTVNNFTYLTSNLINAYPEYRLTDLDSIYSLHGDYILSKDSLPAVIFPFVDFTMHKQESARSWEIKEEESHFIISRKIFGPNLSNYSYVDNNRTLKVEVFDGKNIRYLDIPVNVYLADDEIKILIGKVLVEEVPVWDVNLINCRNSSTEFGKREAFSEELEVYSKDRACACFSYGRPFLAHWNGYLVKVSTERISGEPLFFYIVGNKSNNQSKIEENLPSGVSYFVLGTGAYYDDGYIFGFQNISYTGKETVNKLKSLDIFAFPFDYVKNIQLVKNGSIESDPVYSNFIDIKKKNYSYYAFIGGNKSYDTLVINQAFDPGWIALCGLKKCGAEHIKVNNWANGWVFENGMPDNVKVLFWPQVLEYVGFGLLAVSLIFSFRYNVKSASKFPPKEGREV